MSGTKQAAVTETGGWIEWNGGSVPVADGTVVEVKWRDGSIHKGREWSNPFSAYCNAFWQHTRPPEDHIIAYRIPDSTAPDPSRGGM